MPASAMVAADRRTELTSRCFQVLADPTRVRIVALLLAGEHNVGALVAALGMQQGRVSSHLACLRWCGFSGTRRDGKYISYRVTDPRVRDLIRLAHALLAEHAGAIASCFRLDAAQAL